jgi:NAD(P)-dependent dehydrogenase (short-subunit alcohol dehydrogenase family)
VIRALVLDMHDKKTWFITGAGRGMGVDFATAALAAGHAVVRHWPQPRRHQRGTRRGQAVS